MKNIVAKLTLRQLKLNKRRTLISIIGIALSVAMLTATSTFMSSFVDTARRQSLKSDGEYHAYLMHMPMKNTEKIKDEFPNVEEIMYIEEKYAPIPQQDNKRFFFIESYSENAFDHFRIDLADGRLPEKDGELIISKEAATAGYKIGQRVNLELGSRICRKKDKSSNNSTAEWKVSPHEPYRTENNSYYEEEFIPSNSKTYTIVGIFSDRAREQTADAPYSPVFEAVSFLDPATIKADETVSPYLLFSDTENVDWEEMENIAKSLGVKYYFPNSIMLPFQGFDNLDNMTEAYLIYIAIFITVIIIASVAFIYNAFAISLADRSRYLALLTCIGASNKQKRLSVLLEGIVLGAVSIPLGLLAGFGITAATFKIVNPYFQQFFGYDVDFRLAVSPIAVIVSILLSMLTILLSLIVPMIKASKSPSIEAVRRSSDFINRKKPIRASKLTKRLFGFEGELALKNIKRNPRRYIITVVSLTVSVILFLVTVGGINYMNESYAVQDEDKENDNNAIIFMQHGGDEGNSRQDVDNLREIFEELARDSKTEWISHIDSVEVKCAVPTECFADNEATDKFKHETILPDENKYLISATLISSDTIYRDKSVKDPMDNVSEDEAVLINSGRVESFGEKYELLYNKILKNIPDEIDIMLAYYKNEAPDEINNLPNKFEFTSRFNYTGENVRDEEKCGIPLGNIKIGDSTNINFVKKENIYFTGLELVIHPELFEKIVAEIEKAEPTPKHTAQICIRSDDPYEACRIATEIAAKNGVRIDTVNWEEENENTDSIATIISFFSFGFIALIILICIANILNTITAGISLRRREFAMLKTSGMSPEAFKRMIMYESLLYAFKAIIYGVPISVIIIMCIVFGLRGTYEISFFAVFPWLALVIAVIVIFLLVGSTSLYALRKTEKDTVIDVLKDENT